MKPKRWTKISIGEMTGAIETWLLLNKPMGYITKAQSDAFNEAVTRTLADAERRKRIVVSGITSLRNIVADRARDNQKTADHFEKNPNVMGDSTPEMVERFTNLARVSLQAVKKTDELLARIEAEGLPPEVLAYDPRSR